MVRRSSAVEQLTVNQLVVGSIPTAGANKIKGLAEKLTSFLLPRIIWGHAGDTFFALNRANHPQNSPFTDQAIFDLLDAAGFNDLMVSMPNEMQRYVSTAQIKDEILVNPFEK